MTNNVLLQTDFTNFKLFRRGKVRDVYDLGDKLLIVSTDRISCFDVVLPCGIPNKGKVLTGLSCFWFDFIKDMTRHHLITSKTNEYPKDLNEYESVLFGRSMLVKKTKPFPIECIVRGYLSGSGWKEYQEKQSICGIKLPAGLKESDKLREIIFTPSTKADAGHDINISQKQAEDLVGAKAMKRIRDLSINIYKKAAGFALARGIIIADTKFEFGSDGDDIILIDEVLTPDSSRFWPLEQYQPGMAQASFDKQFVRDHLAGLNWDKTPPAPNLPDEIIEKTSFKYLEAYKKIIGNDLPY